MQNLLNIVTESNSVWLQGALQNYRVYSLNSSFHVGEEETGKRSRAKFILALATPCVGTQGSHFLLSLWIIP
jgi:hypothetical protein